MAKPRKQKKPPERSCPRGAKDSKPFPGAIGRGRQSGHLLGRNHARDRATVFEAYRQLPC